MDWLPINWAIIKEPYNWIIIFLIVVLIGQSLNLIFGGNGAPVDQGS